jgi:cell division protein ZapA
MPQIDVTILDREYRLSVADEDRLRLLEAVRMVDEKMRVVRDSGRISGIERIAVMVALQFAHQLLGSDGSAVGPKSADMANRIRKMSEDLDAELKRQEALFPIS